MSQADAGDEDDEGEVGVGKSVVIGLDIGTTHVRAAELEFGSKDPASLRRYGEAPLPPGAVRDGEVNEPALVSEALKRLWTQTKFASRDVVIGVGNQRVMVRDLDLPWLPPAQLKQALPFHVKELLPVNADDALLDFLPTEEFAGPQGRMLKGLLVAAQRDTVSANVLAVEGAGLRPTMVDLNAFALFRSLVKGEHTERTLAIVDVGARLTTVVVASEGVPRLARTILSGGATFTDAVARALSVSHPEAEQIKREVGLLGHAEPGREAAVEAIAAVAQHLVDAIRNTFVYYAGNHPGSRLEHLVLTGGGAHLPGFGQYLSSASRLPASLGDPFAAIRFSGSTKREQLVGHEATAVLPVGLAQGVAA